MTNNIDPNDPNLQDLASMAKMLSRFSERPVSYQKLWHYLNDNGIPTVKKGRTIYTRWIDIMDIPVTVTMRFLAELSSAAKRRGEDVLSESVKAQVAEEVKKQMAKVIEQKSSEEEGQRRLISQALEKEADENR